MKSIHCCLVSFGAAVLLLGCDKNPPTPQADQPVTAQDVKQDYKQALRSTKEYAGQTKDEFVASMNQKMRDLDAKIDELKSRSADYKDDAKVQADKALDSLHQQRESLGTKFDELKQASKDGWEKTKDAFATAWDDLQKAYDDTKAKFK